MNEKKEKLIRFIESNYLIDYGSDFQDDTDLFREGLIDSFGYVQLVGFLREELALIITEEDLVSDALSSLSNISKRIEP